MNKQCSLYFDCTDKTLTFPPQLSYCKVNAVDPIDVEAEYWNVWNITIEIAWSMSAATKK